MNSSSSLIFDLGISLKNTKYPKKDLYFEKEQYFTQGEYEVIFKSQKNANLFLDNVLINTSQNLNPKYTKVDNKRKLDYFSINISEGLHIIRIELPNKGGRKYVHFDMKKLNHKNDLFYENPYNFQISIPADLALNMSKSPETNWNLLIEEVFLDYLKLK